MIKLKNYYLPKTYDPFLSKQLDFQSNLSTMNSQINRSFRLVFGFKGNVIRYQSRKLHVQSSNVKLILISTRWVFYKFQTTRESEH